MFSKKEIAPFVLIVAIFALGIFVGANGDSVSDVLYPAVSAMSSNTNSSNADVEIIKGVNEPAEEKAKPVQPMENIDKSNSEPTEAKDESETPSPDLGEVVPTEEVSAVYDDDSISSDVEIEPEIELASEEEDITAPIFEHNNPLPAPEFVVTEPVPAELPSIPVMDRNRTRTQRTQSMQSVSSNVPCVSVGTMGHGTASNRNEATNRISIPVVPVKLDDKKTPTPSVPSALSASSTSVEKPETEGKESKESKQAVPEARVRDNQTNVKEEPTRKNTNTKGNGKGVAVVVVKDKSEKPVKDAKVLLSNNDKAVMGATDKNGKAVFDSLETGESYDAMVVSSPELPTSSVDVSGSVPAQTTIHVTGGNASSSGGTGSVSNVSAPSPTPTGGISIPIASW